MIVPRYSLKVALIAVALLGAVAASIGYWWRRPITFLTIKAHRADALIYVGPRRLGPSPVNLTASDVHNLFPELEAPTFRETQSRAYSHVSGFLIGRKLRSGATSDKFIWLAATDKQEQFHVFETPWGNGISCHSGSFVPGEIVINPQWKNAHTTGWIKDWQLRTKTAAPEGEVDIEVRFGGNISPTLDRPPRLRVVLGRYDSKVSDDQFVTTRPLGDAQHAATATIRCPAKVGDYCVTISVDASELGPQSWHRSNDIRLLTVK